MMKCPRCGEPLVYTDGKGKYLQLNDWTVSEQKRVKQCSHECPIDVEGTTTTKEVNHEKAVTQEMLENMAQLIRESLERGEL